MQGAGMVRLRSCNVQHPKHSKFSEYHQNLLSTGSYSYNLLEKTPLKTSSREEKRTWPPAPLCFTVTAYSLLVGLVGPLRMDLSSFHWRMPWDLERVESWILWQAILLIPAKRPPPPGGWASTADPAGWNVVSLCQHPGWLMGTRGGWAVPSDRLRRSSG